MKKFKIYCILFGAVLISCKSNPEQSKTLTAADSSQVTTDSLVYPANLEADSFPNGELIHERGLLKEIEDSGYPFFNLLIEFPERRFEENFVLNLEEVGGLNATKLAKIKGKYFDFSYTSEIQNSLLDIRVKGVSIFDTDVIVINDDASKITGTLAGAEEATAGDLPGTVTITTAKGMVYEFSFYVTEEMVAQNGKTVTAFFEERTRNEIRSLTPLKTNF